MRCYSEIWKRREPSLFKFEHRNRAETCTNHLRNLPNLKRSPHWGLVELLRVFQKIVILIRLAEEAALT